MIRFTFQDMATRPGFSTLLRQAAFLACAGMFALLFPAVRPVVAQEEISTVRDLVMRGTVESLIGDLLTITDADGKSTRLRIQTDPQRPIMLTGGSVPLNTGVRIRVRGEASPELLVPGMTIEAEGELDRQGRMKPVQRVKLLAPGSPELGIAFTNGLPAGSAAALAQVSGTIRAINREVLTVAVPRSSELRRDQVKLEIAGLERVEVEFALTGMIRRGDIVRELAASEVSTGDLVVRAIDVELVGVRDDLRLGIDDQLRIRYAHLSNDPVAPREERSRNILLRTDLSPRRAAILLDRLETMLELVSDYYGRPLRQPIQCVVVDNLAQWNTAEIPERPLGKIRNGEGTTEYRRVGREQSVIVWSAANDAVVQHETVHGYCFLVFQASGPLWYAEGMAEVGRFWEPDNPSVNVDPAILGYLRDSQPEPIDDILNDARVSGELWKPYAWRWALCHLMVNNPNYTRDFHGFGRTLLNDYDARDPGAPGMAVEAFRSKFGDQGRELDFEYRHMLEHLNRGLRVDLCAWDWKAPFGPLSPGKSVEATVAAARGWQATGVRVARGESFTVAAAGTWHVDGHSGPCDANGKAGSGHGRLVGTLLNDYRLSPEFELGSEMVWTAETDGDLYLRCREPLAAVADNSGELNVTLERNTGN